MNRFIARVSKWFAFVGLVLLLAACASMDPMNNDNLAIASGFKVITPAKPDQRAMLAKLPKDQVSPVNYQGKLYYVIPDSMNNLVYIGGPTQYAAYQRLRVQRQLSNENLEAAQINQMNMEWSNWAGWPNAGFGMWP